MATGFLQAQPPALPAEPFHLSESWQLRWAEAYAEGAPVVVPVGSARLRLRLHERGLGPCRFRLLTSATNLQTCYFDLQGGYASEEALEALPNALLEIGATQARIDWLMEDSALLAAGRGWREGHLVTLEPFAVSPLADCRDDFEVYLGRAGSSLRKYWKACCRHILNGPIEFRIVTGGAGLGSLLDEMFALEASGWKGREGTAILSKAEDTRFYRTLAFDAEAAGALRIATLREEGRLLAYEYCVVGQDRILAMKVGYDEARGRLQPGHMVALMNIRDACSDPAISWYDMLGNGMRVAEYKRRFATDYVTLWRVRLFARTPAGWLLYALYRAKPLAKELRNRCRGLLRRLAA
jgi:CelD/BcsL family acetyltransferase involved in cellulose biosynthesis